MSSCLIISGGDFCPFTVPSGAFVIACDRGYAYAQSCGVRPDLVLGDFDSYRGELAPGIPLRKLPVEKDDTDTMSALRFALDRGYREITLVCALGGRLDHMLANLQAAVFAAKRGAALRILGADTEIQTLRAGTLRIPRREGWSLSVFAAEDRCRGVSAHQRLSPGRQQRVGGKRCGDQPAGGHAADRFVPYPLIILCQLYYVDHTGYLPRHAMSTRQEQLILS